MWDPKNRSSDLAARAPLVQHRPQNPPSMPVREDNLVACFHCGNGIVRATTHKIQTHTQYFCCVGCANICDTIYRQGLQKYYQSRSGASHSLLDRKPTPNYAAYGDLELLNEISWHDEDQHRHVELFIEGITCAACIWLLENALVKYIGIQSFSLNSVSHHATLVWDPKLIELPALLQKIGKLGYQAKPLRIEDSPDGHRQSQQLLSQIGVAGLFGAQIMMLATSLYFGEAYGMELRYQWLIGGVSLLLALPILLYSAQPFFKSGWNALKQSQLIMDSNVSLALLLAFTASLINLVQGTIELYFDAVAMFVFFLLVSRYLELRLRVRAHETVASLNAHLPITAHKLLGNGLIEEITATRLEPGDTIRILPGEMIPVDGTVSQGRSGVDNSLITGESTPKLMTTGDPVIGGSQNTDGELNVAVTAHYRNSQLQKILSSVQHAQSNAKQNLLWSDHLAPKFIGFVILLALSTGLYYGFYTERQWLPIVLAVLVVACPCALSLAVPTANIAAQLRLLAQQILCTNLSALAMGAKITHVVFDKTGTLTEGKFQLSSVNTTSTVTENACLQIAATMESPSTHPIAHAFKGFESALNCDQWQAHPGLGLSAVIESQRYFLGRLDWIQTQTYSCEPSHTMNQTQHELITEVWLADEQKIICCFGLIDKLRAQAFDLLHTLKTHRIQPIILSGDQPQTVSNIAQQLSIDKWCAQQTPEQKQFYIESLQKRGNKVLMCGDGSNDALALWGADVSVSLHQGTSLAKVSSHFILLNDQLMGVWKILDLSHHLRRIGRQNIFWALSYNFCLIPIAAFGMIKPWQAAIGMAVSSLLVVANSTRLHVYRTGRN